MKGYPWKEYGVFVELSRRDIEEFFSRPPGHIPPRATSKNEKTPIDRGTSGPMGVQGQKARYN